MLGEGGGLYKKMNQGDSMEKIMELIHFSDDKLDENVFKFKF